MLQTACEPQESRDGTRRRWAGRSQRNPQRAALEQTRARFVGVCLDGAARIHAAHPRAAQGAGSHNEPQGGSSPPWPVAPPHGSSGALVTLAGRPQARPAGSVYDVPAILSPGGGAPARAGPGMVVRCQSRAAARVAVSTFRSMFPAGSRVIRGPITDCTTRIAGTG